MDKVKSYKMRTESRLLPDTVYNWHDGGEGTKSDSKIEFKNDGTITWKEEEE